MAETPLVAIRGGGDLGSACALRLYRCGFRILVTEQESPVAVRRTVSFSEAVFDRTTVVEGIQGVLARGGDETHAAWSAGQIPVLVDPSMDAVLGLRPDIVVDAVMAKENRGMRPDLAPGTIGLGPGFTAGVDVQAVIETNRGPNLGRVFWEGTAEKNTHTPAPVAGHAADRVLRAPRSGALRTDVGIGAIVKHGESLADVSGSSVPALFDGLVRGLLRPGSEVREGMKIGDLDPRLDASLCYRVSDKALAIAGGVVEASMVLLCRAGWEMTRVRP